MKDTNWFLPAPTKGRFLDEVGTKRLSIAGTSGAGKTYAVMRLCELLYEKKNPFVFIDTVGNAWGLRVAKDGKSPGLQIPVLGGMHGDMELQSEAGPLIAEFLHKTRSSLVLDISMLDEDERPVFIVGFTSRLLELWMRRRQVLTIIADEAQDIMPELTEIKGERAMVRWLKKLGLQGRNFGIGLVMVTQAPQNVVKRLFNLADLLVAGRLGGSHERKAVENWVKQKGLGKDALDELAALPTGTLYAWSASWLEFFSKVKTTERWTFDSSKTPELGDVPLLEGALAPVDLEKLGAALRALGKKEETEQEEETGEASNEENDDVASKTVHESTLREEDLTRRLDQQTMRLVELEREVEQKTSRIWQLENELKRYTQTFEELPGLLGMQLGRVKDDLVRLIEPLKTNSLLSNPMATEWKPAALVTAVADSAAPYRAERRVVPSGLGAPLVPKKKVRGEGEANDSESSAEYETEVLSAIVAYGPMSRVEISIMAGKSMSSSTFAGAVRNLEQTKLIHQADGRKFMATAAGKIAAGRPPLVMGKGCFEYWCRRLGDYDTQMLDALARRVAGIQRKELAEAAQHSYTSSTFAGSIRRLKKFGFCYESRPLIGLTPFARRAFGLTLEKNRG